MKIETHIKNSLKRCGIKGADIHEWIDGHFEHDKFNDFKTSGILPKDWDPYGHRVHRHCIESLDECLIEFKDKYTPTEIKDLFESHLIDDYRGYIPKKDDFLEKAFHEKYHIF